MSAKPADVITRSTTSAIAMQMAHRRGRLVHGRCNESSHLRNVDTFGVGDISYFYAIVTFIDGWYHREATAGMFVSGDV